MDDQQHQPLGEINSGQPAITTTSPAGDLLVVAETPGELQIAQDALVAWFKRKLQSVQVALTDASRELENAIAAKWHLNPFRKMVRDLTTEQIYYEKALRAVEEGYCIVPDFPVELVAVRTSKEAPTAKSCETSGWRPSFREDAESLPLGEGEFVNRVNRVALDYVDKDEAGNRRSWWSAAEFREVALPVKFMKPRVLAATQRAMALKVFDEIGILPRQRKADPIVVGRILRRNRALTFLICWFLDSRDL